MGKNKIDALIFDLDGVVTKTQKLHKEAWKEMFDAFLKDKEGQAPMSDEDYKVYVDGKPRYQGVKSFLDSRDISLPFGNTDDPPEKETACGLGNRKNKIFHRLVEQGGVEVYPGAVEKIKTWRKKGLKTAIVSSSKNCKKIIEHAGIAHLFDARVDGAVSEERGLNGKPDPDIFVEAAKDLGVSPENAVVFEDAISGVQAGQRGYFGLVVGLNRFENAEALKENGADLIIDNFEDFELFDNPEVQAFFSTNVPLIFSGETDLFDRLKEKKPVFFLDYDGTLTPIVSRPEDAVISDEMRNILKRLAEIFTVAVVTGRDKEDVENMVRLDNLIYAGSHGFIITGPDGLYKEHEKSEEIVKDLDEIEKDIESELEGKTEGVQLDRKRYAIGLHYRNAREEDEPFVYELVEKMLKKYQGFKKGEGKKIVEIKPDVDWHKGKAVLWVLDALNISEKENIPVFIGDDVTDEDAFEALKDKGIGIIVENQGQKTAAGYALKNVFQVGEFFKKLIDIYSNR